MPIVSIPAQMPSTGFSVSLSHWNFSGWLKVAVSLRAVPERIILSHWFRSSLVNFKIMFYCAFVKCFQQLQLLATQTRKSPTNPSSSSCQQSESFWNQPSLLNFENSTSFPSLQCWNSRISIFFLNSGASKTVVSISPPSPEGLMPYFCLKLNQPLYQFVRRFVFQAIFHQADKQKSLK